MLDFAGWLSSVQRMQGQEQLPLHLHREEPISIMTADTEVGNRYFILNVTFRLEVQPLTVLLSQLK